MTDLAHFAYPFAFSSTGVANVAEQDSVEEIGACVTNIVVCPLGYRTDSPDFGLPDLMFGPTPIDTNIVDDAITQWEPRVTLATEEYGDVINAALRNVQVTAMVVSGQ